MRKILKVSKNVKSANFWQIILKKSKKSKKIYFLKKEGNLRKNMLEEKKFVCQIKYFTKRKIKLFSKNIWLFPKIYIIRSHSRNAQMVELVDTTVLEAVAMRCEGSSPSLGTIWKLKEFWFWKDVILFIIHLVFNKKNSFLY